MRHTITQEDDMGCGAACVAFAAHKTYQEAVHVLGQDKARSVGYQLKDLVDGLAQYGFKYRSMHVAPNMKPLLRHDGAIVFIARSVRYPFGHYLIRYSDEWMDPWINLVSDRHVNHATSGYRTRLPGKAQWILVPVD